MLTTDKEKKKKKDKSWWGTIISFFYIKALKIGELVLHAMERTWINISSSPPVTLFFPLLRRAAPRLLVHGLSSDLHRRRPGIVHWLASHPAPYECQAYENGQSNNRTTENLRARLGCKWWIQIRINTTNQILYLFLISAAMAMKACSTLVASLALVSMKGIPISSAKA